MLQSRSGLAADDEGLQWLTMRIDFDIYKALSKLVRIAD